MSALNAPALANAVGVYAVDVDVDRKKRKKKAKFVREPQAHGTIN